MFLTYNPRQGSTPVGEAEDAVFAREAREQEARHAADNQKIQELTNKILSYVPRAIDRLRGLGWPDGPYPIRRKTFTMNGKDRVGWEIYADGWHEHVTYLLSDGTFARGMCSNPTPVGPGTPCPFELTEAEEAVEGIRVLAEGGMPTTRGVVSPPLW